MGVPLRRLREERRLKQNELATLLDISASYLNQLEQNQRPLTVPVLLKLNAALGIDLRLFSDTEDGRLITELREILSEAPEPVSLAEVREIATQMPAVGRAIVALHRRERETHERGEAMAAILGDGWAPDDAARAPFEQVLDFVYARSNHFESLDRAAERFHADAKLAPNSMHAGLFALLLERHAVRIVFEEDGLTLRSFDPATLVLRISAHLGRGRQVFQMAVQLAFLEMGDELDRLALDPMLRSPDARALARVGLANYFAGALMLPYSAFRNAAETENYDIERLMQRFDAGFETVCHRLSTLQRSEAPGVPFLLVRVDRAGNVSKRQSATDFHFSRVGGSCPLWNVYEAFAQPGRILTQLAQMPDGRTYLWVARTVGHGGSAFGVPGKTFAIGLGCDVRHAGRLVYSKGLDLKDPSSATPIGAGCKVCDRPNCPQRAFPPIGRSILVDPNSSTSTPYRWPRQS